MGGALGLEVLLQKARLVLPYLRNGVDLKVAAVHLHIDQQLPSAAAAAKANKKRSAKKDKTKRQEGKKK
jgi:hypothetical protein